MGKDVRFPRTIYVTSDVEDDFVLGEYYATIEEAIESCAIDNEPIDIACYNLSEVKRARMTMKIEKLVKYE